MRIMIFCAIGALLALSACGRNTLERATTGAAAGAVVAGPVGAVAGAALGGSGAVEVRRPRGY